MSKKRIRLLAIFMGIALAGLIIIQTQYFISAGEVRKDQFTHAVNRALEEVIQFLQEKEKMTEIEKSLGFEDSNSKLKEYIRRSGNDYIDIDQKVRFYLGEHNSYRPTISTYFNIFEKDSLVYSVNDSQSKQKKGSDLSITAKRLQQQLRNKVLRRNYTLRQMASQITFSRRELKDKLLNIELKNIIAEKLEENGVYNDFEYAVKEDKKYIDLSSNYLNQETEYRFKKRLFPDDVILSNGTLHVIFPDRGKIIAGSFFMLFPSLLTSILLLLTCAVTIYVIFKQKKLSTIKNDFINNMTHELKTPISTISLASQMLKDNSINNSEIMINNISKIISEESTRLTNQIEKVLQMAVFTESRLKLKQKNIQFHKLITELSSRFNLIVNDHNGSLLINLNANNDIVYADEVHISNIITNLLDNAIKYCKTEPNIKITTENKNEGILIYVEDSGIGIAKKDQKMIFERFYRVTTGNVHDVKGFGLGLSYVKKIVEAHGGNVSLESSIDKGSTFKIYLPLSTISD